MRSKEREHNGSNDFNVLESNVKRFGCWNVRSVNSREELFTEMKKYRLEVLGVSETKVKENGMKQGMYHVYFQVYRREERKVVWRFCCQRELAVL